ncbi:GNAT family N-acetyltransferase [Nocardioides acrostichi]|uniref:GNAT family N-acetyltransferase n=1 Tax=Nocardioides acrostichi TaxID=2784339 RepID=UPI002E2D778F|nr:GNAT family protein [Nocardioides acrostichi]
MSGPPSDRPGDRPSDRPSDRPGDRPVGAPVEGWAPRPRPAHVVHEGRWVRLEPVGAGHVDDLFAATCAESDDDLWTYRPVPRPSTRDDLAAMVEQMTSDELTVTFALVVDGAARGVATLMRVEPAHGVIEVGGVLFGRTLQRTTAATEAMHLLMRHCLDDLGYRRFEWKCDSLNEPSRRAAARLGFTYEGRFRQHLVVKGRNRDTDWFAITDADWPAIRTAHERWLDPTNFDDRGQQRTPLSR